MNVPFEIFEVCEETNIVDFANEKVTAYEHSSGYGYFEFIEPEYIQPHQKIIIMKEVKFLLHKIIVKGAHIFLQNGELVSGPGVHKFVGAVDAYDYEEQLKPPNLSGTEYTRVFIQSRSYERILPPKTRFLYCKPTAVTVICYTIASNC